MSPAPPARLPDADTVHAWVARLNLSDAQLADLAPLLSPRERARAGRFHFARDRRRYVAAHAALRLLLGQYLDQPPAEVRIEAEENRKPVLAAAGLFFSLSHSEDRALVAFASTPEIGADLEFLRPVADARQIAARFFSPAEARALAATAPGRLARAFLECWTRKEAYVKAIGDGLAFPLDRFTVSLGEPARLVAIGDDAAEAARWSLHHLELGGGYLGAVACRRAAARVLSFRFSPFD